MNADAIITIGRNATCDVQLDDPSVSGLHAQARLDSSGFLWVRDENSAGGMFLHRNDNWVQAQLIAVCAGDTLRFGQVEVPLDRITGAFEDEAEVRLARAPDSCLLDARTGRYTLRNQDDEPTLSNPRRDPTSGKVEGKDS